MKCTSCGFPYAPHELAGGLCLACLAKLTATLRSTACELWVRGFNDPTSHRLSALERFLGQPCYASRLTSAINAIPADLSIEQPSKP